MTAAVRLEIKKNRLGSKRSASPKNALITVPITNPSCIELVNIEIRVCEKSCSNMSDGTTAVVANHKAMVRITLSVSILIERYFSDTMNHPVNYKKLL